MAPGVVVAASPGPYATAVSTAAYDLQPSCHQGVDTHEAAQNASHTAMGRVKKCHYCHNCSGCPCLSVTVFALPVAAAPVVQDEPSAVAGGVPMIFSDVPPAPPYHPPSRG